MHKAWAIALVLLLASPLFGAGSADGGPTVWIWTSPDDGQLDAATAYLQAAHVHHNVLPTLGMVTFIATEATAQSVATAFGGSIEVNEKLDLHLDRSVAYIEADVVKQRIGLVRDGPTVLVVDTGIDSAHPDFQQTLAANVQPQVQGGLVVGDLDQLPVVDPAGHGTHVGGIVSGTGAAFGPVDGQSGRYQGVYSVGRVASYQVTLDDGTSGEPQVDTAASLQAFEWALVHRKEFDLQVVTNSWGASGDFEPDAAVNQATLQLYKAGFTVVFSGGNEGRDGADTLNKYCMAPWVLCVAAGDLNGARADFSSIGDIDKPYKHPDLSAPGLQITSANPVTSMGSNLPLGSSVSQGLYTQRSGTSMAAPHVAAVAGLVLAANPSLSPDQVMDILVATTTPMADDTERIGSGYLNARKAFNTAVATTGTRSSFMEGLWKYAGPESGDNAYARDALSVGYDGVIPESEILRAQEEGLWILSPVAWVIIALALVASLMGIQWRKPRPARQLGTPTKLIRVPPSGQRSTR